jgi:hypothetical protein
VARALVEACHGAAERVLEAYNALLAQHGPMANPTVKLQLLRSVHSVLAECAAAAAAVAASTDAARQLRALAERCRVYKTLVPPLQVRCTTMHDARPCFGIPSAAQRPRSCTLCLSLSVSRRGCRCCRCLPKPSARSRLPSTSCERACCRPLPTPTSRTSRGHWVWEHDTSN